MSSMKRYFEDVVEDANAVFIEFLESGEKPTNPYGDEQSQARDLWAQTFERLKAEKNAWSDQMDKEHQAEMDGIEAFDYSLGILAGLKYHGTPLERIFVLAYSKREAEYAAHVEMQASQVAWQNEYENA